MKTFRFIGAAMLAAVMCVNFTSCSKDDDPVVEGGGDVVAGSKKLAKVVSEGETYTFSYDDEGRLTTASVVMINGENRDNYEYEFIWGDDVIRVKENSYNYTLTLNNGLVQNGDGKTFSYNKSNRFVKGTSEHNTTDVIWNGDKLVNIEDIDYDGHHWEKALTYGETCKKGYLPLIPLMIDFGCDILFMAHPEIAGMRTNQLPSTYKIEDGTVSFTYAYDKDGYVSKMIFNEGGASMAYTFTWE